MAKRILVIDDDDLLRELARISLERVSGWAVLLAASGREGLETAVAEQPDAILLDVVMPDMDGPATFGELRAHPSTRQIPVILLTADEGVPGRLPSAGSGAGVTAVIAKPFQHRQLAGQVAEALGWVR